MDDLHSLKTNKQTLVRNKVWILVSLAQLVTSKCASSKDHDNSSTQEAKEEPHAHAQCTSGATAEVSEEVIAEEDTEEDEDDDLERQTS